METITFKTLVKVIGVMMLAVPVAGIYAEVMRIISKHRGRAAREVAYSAISKCLAVMSGVMCAVLVGLYIYAR